MWTVTLRAFGLSETFQAASLLGTYRKTTTDFEGRVMAHDYQVIAVDEEHQLVTAFYARSRAMTRRPYRRRARE